MKLQVVLEKLTDLLTNELSEVLTGIYLHGSAAMGCFNSNQSDIDILVLIKREQPKATYIRIAKGLIQLEEEMKSSKGFELSIVLDTYAVDFVYPTPFEFHYSLFHKTRYQTDENYFCGGYEDPDLAAHFVVTYNRGIVLYGQPIKEAFRPIDHHFYLDSIKSDVDGALEGIIDHPVYYVLNLARVLLYVKDAVISSKKEAGEWALTLHELPSSYKDIIAECLTMYESGLTDLHFDEKNLFNYSEYMLSEIDKNI